MRPIPLALALLCISSAALAQPQADPPSDEKSPAVALGLSIGTTAAGVAMMISSPRTGEEFAVAGLGLAAAGPCAGYLYTGEYRRAAGLGLLQGLGATAFAVGFDMALDGEDEGNARILFLAGSAALVAGTIYGFTDAPRSARRVNEKAKRALRIAPTPVIGPQRSTGLGLGLSGSF